LGRRRLQVQERRQKGFHPSVLEEVLVADGRASPISHGLMATRLLWLYRVSLPRTMNCMLVPFLSLSGGVQQQQQRRHRRVCTPHQHPSPSCFSPARNRSAAAATMVATPRPPACLRTVPLPACLPPSARYPTAGCEHATTYSERRRRLRPMQPLVDL
jgi:hypothetical protein